MALAVLACAAACASTDPAAPAPEPNRSEPASGVDPVQLAPAPGGRTLSPQQLRAAVTSALADPAVAAAVGFGDIASVQVRADEGDGRTVAFLFRAPIEPAGNPWPVLCDIAGQTKQWKGVAAKIIPRGRPEVDGSPVWLTGSNCVGAKIEE